MATASRGFCKIWEGVGGWDRTVNMFGFSFLKTGLYVLCLDYIASTFYLPMDVFKILYSV